MALIFGKGSDGDKSREMSVWEDNEIRFDVPFSEMKLRAGEKLIDKLDSVEDTKGNGGDKGRLMVTNLRILWHSLSTPRISLSIGLNTVINITTKNVISGIRGIGNTGPESQNREIEDRRHSDKIREPDELKIHFNIIRKPRNTGSDGSDAEDKIIFSLTEPKATVKPLEGLDLGAKKLRGSVEALYLLTKVGSNKYEFIFTNLIPGTTRLFTSVMGVHRAYSTSKMYRELKLRGAVVKNKQFQPLPLEHIVSTETGVWNLSSEQGNLGTFIITNVRLIWFADMNEHFNISLPYLQIALVKIRESKFGIALVVETSESSGGYVMGFRIDPFERLKVVFREIQSLHNVYSNSPLFGVEYTIGSEPLLPEEPPTLPEVVEEIDEDSTIVSPAINAYLSAGSGENNCPPVYCPELGLAVERVKDNFTMQSLWEVIPSA